MRIIQNLLSMWYVVGGITLFFVFYAILRVIWMNLRLYSVTNYILMVFGALMLLSLAIMLWPMVLVVGVVLFFNLHQRYIELGKKLDERKEPVSSLPPCQRDSWDGVDAD